MNLIPNGIKHIEKVDRVDTETDMYFLITFTDWYGRKGRTKKVTTIKDIDKLSWTE